MTGYVEEKDHDDVEFALVNMPRFSAAVLTAVPDDAEESPGDVVIRIYDEFEYLGGSETWDTLISLESGYYARPLAANERIVIEN